MLTKKQRTNKRLRRKRRVRQKVFGESARPRMTIYRSNRHMYAQLINDLDGQTVVAASTLELDSDDLDKTAQAREVGRMVAERAQEQGIEKVVFDRNGYIYHGRVAAVADGARDAGLDF
jgi:large subunit ribosomal protein L18